MWVRSGTRGVEAGRWSGVEPGRGRSACCPVAPGVGEAAAPHLGTWTMSDSGISVTQ